MKLSIEFAKKIQKTVMKFDVYDIIYKNMIKENYL
jgi:hypothetical protein